MDAYFSCLPMVCVKNKFLFFPKTSILLIVTIWVLISVSIDFTYLMNQLEDNLI